MADEPLRTCTGRQLYGAWALTGRYFERNAGADRRPVFERVAEFHELVGLTDGWMPAALEIGQTMAAGIVEGLGVPPTAAFAAISVIDLRAMLASSYVRGMAIGSMAALNVIDPGLEGGTRE